MCPYSVQAIFQIDPYSVQKDPYFMALWTLSGAPFYLVQTEVKNSYFYQIHPTEHHLHKANSFDTELHF